MEIVIMILTPLEMLLVNLFVIHKCSQRKYSQAWTYVSMGVVVCVLLYISYLISRNAPGFGGGNGLFVFSGLLFFIPIKLIYKAPGVKIVTIACFSWIYTFVLFALSVRFGYAFAIPGMDLHGTVLLIQTLLYVFTFNAFYRMLMSKFVYVLEHIGKKKAVALMWMAMMWFWSVFVFNLSYAYPDIRLFQILAFPTLAGCILSSFRYIYLQVNSSATIQNLESLAYRDELTQLRTRVVLGKDAEDLITRKMPFHLIFFDLNNFKSINDTYGHHVGDRYLAFFAHEIKIRIGNRGGFYRIAGDEFVCLLPEGGLDAFLEAIGTLPDMMTGSQVKFLGFSYGIATFPEDGGATEILLEFADHHMYVMKRIGNNKMPSEFKRQHAVRLKRTTGKTQNRG